MPKKNVFADLVQQLSEALPTHFGALKKDFEKNCHHILTQAFAKFDLVMREEFDAQTKVLARTRKKLETLELKLSELESLLKSKRRH